MQTQTLATAVINVINTLRSVGTPFSAYDVTTVIRGAVNGHIYRISDIPKDTIEYRGSLVQSVPHEMVRDVVNELTDSHVLSNVFGITRLDTGTYQEYSFPKGTGLAAYVATTPQPNTKFVRTTIKSVRQVGSGIKQNPILSRIEKYVETKGQRTLKQVQSALYPTKVTCDSLVKLVQLSPNLSLSKASDVSKSLVFKIC